MNCFLTTRQKAIQNLPHLLDIRKPKLKFILIEIKNIQIQNSTMYLKVAPNEKTIWDFFLIFKNTANPESFFLIRVFCRSEIVRCEVSF